MPELEPHHARAIGEKVRAVRQQQQMSLRDLASRAEISASMLSQIETGKAFPSVRSIYSIAAALVVPVDYFFPDQISGDAVADEPATGALGVMTASELRDARVNEVPDRSALEFGPHSPSPTPIVHAAARPTIELKGGVTWSRLTARAEPTRNSWRLLTRLGRHPARRCRIAKAASSAWCLKVNSSSTWASSDTRCVRGQHHL
jgi:transcriptional regulator with XRE-family HTH domain